ncbi:MAG TPA: CheR family methyltransferase [Blastocatellia bacterium]|nr:CheR family methyltransferase [Blastocatellia bacterium]
MTEKGLDSQFEALLDYLKRSRGFDFTAYKRASLMRRISRRMQEVRLTSYEEYMDYLEVHPEEFSYLFNIILINVTSFFRDETAWEYLKSDIIPRILSRKGPDDPVRVWCAGTASGEEAYSIAMLLAEAMGEEQFRERAKIYATDLDEDALSQARQASYNVKQIGSVPQEYLRKYFEQTDSRFAFRKDLRRSVIFGRHDLIQDAPISRVDLLICRNTLMYFNAEVQARILAHFHFALVDEGILFLGKSEMLLTHTNIFTPLDLKRRVFTKVPRLSFRDRFSLMTHTGNEEGINHMANNVRMREAAFDANPSAQIILDHSGHLMFANRQARAQFGMTVKDIGRPLQDMEISYRSAEIRSLIEQAYAERRVIKLEDIEWVIAPAEKRYLNIHIMPLITNLDNILGVSVSFVDVTRTRKLQDDLVQSRQELETTYEELQSTNEELETMNEELQSTNEELETINEEMRQRTIELNEVNDFLESILTSLRAGVLVVDQNLRILVWNRRAEDLWGLRAAEVEGQHFLSLDIGLPVDLLKQTVKNCLQGESDYQEAAVEATNRRGRNIECRVVCSPLNKKDGVIRGAILLMEERDSAKRQ